VKPRMFKSAQGVCSKRNNSWLQMTPHRPSRYAPIAPICPIRAFDALTTLTRQASGAVVFSNINLWTKPTELIGR
jgi:hypothetical protein